MSSALFLSLRLVLAAVLAATGVFLVRRAARG